MNTRSLMVRDGRRLSPVRVGIALLLAAAAVVGGLVWFQNWTTARALESDEPWFAAYVDVTATPSFGFESPTSPEAKDVVLSFIVADPSSECLPTWGASYSLDEASEQLDLDRRIARLEQQGGAIMVSFGGLKNDELSTVCTDPAALLAAYSTVVERYHLTTIDLDIEGSNLTDAAASKRRAEALEQLQSRQRAAGNELAVWLTLPVGTSGFSEGGTNAIADMLAAGVDLAGVNAMTMDFGQSKTISQSMTDASIAALTGAQRQLKALYSRAGIELSDPTLWRKLGATPMIGQNDVEAEVFGLDDAAALNAFGHDKGLGRMSMWSLNRDVGCGPNYVDRKRVSDACSGVDQGATTFAAMLAVGFTGRAVFAASAVTTAEPRDPDEYVDDPASSPYAIWSESASYLKGTKVVWHRNVYEAKWWTKGDLPDDPVLNEWETPWLLVGPVLPGETPLPVPTLPEGTYAEWVGTEPYEKGTRVLFDGVPYQAKWWNQGESPEAYSSDPDSSPWVPLTVEEIEKILSGS